MTASDEPRVQVHDALGLESTSQFGAPDQLEAEPRRPFTLEQCWSRGRFVASLFAPTEARSFAWRGDFIRDHLPMLPTDARGLHIEPALFWPKAARLNGCPQRVLQQNSGCDESTIELIVRIAEQQDILFRLPYWAPPGERSDLSDLVYWTDSGLLHRLLNRRNPEELSDQARGKSFEGFAIGALVAAAGPSVIARVWRRGDDEVDLILEWPDSTERWAIEITCAETKRLGVGFQRGLEATQASRAIVIQRKAVPADGRRTADRMPLDHLLREILDDRIGR